MKELTNKIKSIIGFFSKKKYHWYEIKFIYKDKSNNQLVLSWFSQIGFSKRNTVLNSREVKKVLTPLHKDKSMPKSRLKNGFLFCEVKCYLGYMKNPNDK